MLHTEDFVDHAGHETEVIFPKINVQSGCLFNGRSRTLWLNYLQQWLVAMDPSAGNGESAQELRVSLPAPGKQRVHALSLNSWKVLVLMGDDSCLGVLLAAPGFPPDPHSPWRVDGQSESTALHLVVLRRRKSSERLTVPIA